MLMTIIRMSTHPKTDDNQQVDDKEDAKKEEESAFGKSLEESNLEDFSLPAAASKDGLAGGGSQSYLGDLNHIIAASSEMKKIGLQSSALVSLYSIFSVIFHTFAHS